jgi:hypothetical protein
LGNGNFKDLKTWPICLATSVRRNQAKQISASASGERFIQAAYQIFIDEGFAKKSNCPGAESEASRRCFREGSDKDNGNAMTLGNKMTLQFYARHARHLYIRD